MTAEGRGGEMVCETERQKRLESPFTKGRGRVEKNGRWIDTDGEVFVLTRRKNVDMSFMKVR